MATPLEEVALLAFVGEDELGSGEIGLKQAQVPAGIIPIVVVEQLELQKGNRLPVLYGQMEAQARQWGKRIRLVRFVYAEVIWETEAGK